MKKLKILKVYFMRINSIALFLIVKLERNLFANTGENPSPVRGQGSMFDFLIPLIFFFLIFYLLLIRPQSKRKKEHEQFLQGLKKGDEVVTSSGIYGKVYGITDRVVTLEIADGIRIKIEKPYILGLRKYEEEVKKVEK